MFCIFTRPVSYNVVNVNNCNCEVLCLAKNKKKAKGKWLVYSGSKAVHRHVSPSPLSGQMYRGATCDTVPIWEQKSLATEAMSVFTAGMPAKLTRVQLRRHTGGKDCDVSCCRRFCVLICRRTIAGSTGGYVAGTSAAYENQALVEWNSKQSVSFLTCISAFSWRTFAYWTHHKLVYSRKPNSSCVGYSNLNLDQFVWTWLCWLSSVSICLLKPGMFME